MSLSKKILISLVTGVAAGLFFGEQCSFFSYIGDGFISLMQMTVLPFIMVSIIANLGRTSMSEGKELLVKGIKTLLLLLSFGVAALMILPYAMPEWTASSFFKSSITEIQEPIDFLSMYIPANLFGSMANNVVPAVVLFSIFMGIGLSGIKNKEVLLKNLDVITAALNQINKMVVKLTPIGVFAIAAYNSGTMTVGELQRLYAYVIIYTLAVLLLGFYWLPLVISATTGIKPKQLFSATKDTLLTIFATGKIIIVLPQLIDNIKTLFAELNEDTEETNMKTELITPLAYPFPNLGTFVIFIFVPFTAWYVGNNLSLTDHITFLAATIPSSFVAPVTGIPFLLDLLKLPQDMFQLFVMSSVYTDRIRVVLGATHLLALTLITVKWSTSGLAVKWGKILRGFAIGIVLTVLSVIGANYYLGHVLGKSDQYGSFIQMKFTTDYPKGKIVSAENLSLPDSSLLNDHLGLIKKRGVLRVGYYADKLPFAFRNEEGDLLGFDIEMAYKLASELNTKVEFVKITNRESSALLNSGMIDIVMSGVHLTTQLINDNNVSISYKDQTFAFIVPDHLRNDFNSVQALMNKKDVSIAVTDPYYAAKAAKFLPDAKIVNIETPRRFFRSEYKNTDALLYFAEAGSAWTLIYPSFSVAIPYPKIYKVPMVYPLPLNDPKWKNFVDSWLLLKKDEGSIKLLFKHWIEGGGANIKEKRWSVIKDVLKWTE
jgi:Na+/H+-dicarboxylate symporter/ABC-type amino acid transport substrate-binding protein